MCGMQLLKKVLISTSGHITPVGLRTLLNPYYTQKGQ